MATKEKATIGGVLCHPKDAPPCGILAAADVLHLDLAKKEDEKLKKTIEFRFDASGEVLEGLCSCMKYIARSSGIVAETGLYGRSPLAACQIDSFLDFAEKHVVPGTGLDAACASMDVYLSCRTYFVGHELTLADIAIWGQLMAAPQAQRMRQTYHHVDRWFSHIDSLPAMKALAETYAPKKKKAEKSKGVKVTKGDAGDPFAIKLPNIVDGAVVTRFPPEPSGYLHIGHAKAALINQEIADRYHGVMRMRFDDTNPSKEKDEFVENIIEDCKRLKLRYQKITYTSDYFPQLFECADRMIKAGLLYADDTPVEQMREERMHGVESKRRNRPIEETQRIFKEMIAGSEEGVANCLRVKLDMSNPNKALRDPVCFRCNDGHHWRTGYTYKCYPTYDFACPFVDAYEGVTHALRTSEYRDREAQFYMILKLQQSVWPELPHVTMWDYARISFVYTVLSKRKLTWFVTEGIVDGWDDPRMPTVQGILRRGLQIEALREFMLTQGASKNITYQEWDKIWAMNKKYIDPVCPRHTAVIKKDRVTVSLSGAAAETVEVPKHLKYPPAGMKKQIRTDRILIDYDDACLLSEGEEVTLMGWGNAIINTIHRENDTITSIDARLHLQGDFKKTKLKLTWLADTSDVCPLQLEHYGYLITKKKLEEDDTFEDCVNRNSKHVIQALGDVNMRDLKKGDILQLERKGYYIVDSVPADISPDNPVILFDIPDGKAKQDRMIQ
ncbi:Glutamate--tRNA ligase, cytoplasmic [Picochlorum sp. SENEW3]|nr:Glutamate--tRNA ligase, cytoplasmic [Picochlorum sp. SENEW3]WPT17051.1 Glutamate--tRNA ligase, cytoplasmic [Picochlorum sp. SENEW3]